MNQQKKYTVQNLENHHLEQVSEIHQKAFPDSILNLFEQNTIIKYYTWQMSPPNNCLALGVFTENTLLGFCFAGAFRNAEIYFIQEHIFSIFWYFVVHPSIIFDHRILARIVDTVNNFKTHILNGNWKRNKTDQVKSEQFGILSIAVDPSAQRLGVGQTLMMEVEKSARENGYQKIELNVNSNNQNALDFYEKLGWKRINKDQHKPWQGLLEKDLI